MDNTQIVRADKRLKAQVIIGLTVFSVTGAVLIWGMSNYLALIEHLSESDPRLAIEKLQLLVSATRILIAVFSVIFAAHFAKVGTKVWISGRFPPEGMRVIKDTRVLAGGRAKLAAIAHIAFAASILSTNLIGWYLHRMFMRLFLDPLFNLSK